MPKPALNPAILLTPAEDSYLAYDPATDRLHTLNPLAALITELSDGTRTIDQIREIVSPILPEGQSGAVDLWIQQAVDAGLLINDGSSGAAHRELTAKELFDLAHRLENAGKGQTAIICERRVTELAPENPNGWYYLGELAEMLGRRDEELAAYERYLELKPENEEIRHILVALRGEAPPSRMSDKCIRQIYDGFAETFDERLLKDLGYNAPERVRKMIAPLLAARSDQAPPPRSQARSQDAVIPNPTVLISGTDAGNGPAVPASEPRPTLNVLDLGCGTGLAGIQFKPYAARLTGVDLSPEMLALAQKRNLYDRLDQAEITAWLDAASDPFDLILTCDCLIYFGDLGAVATRVARILKPRGILAFTTERGDRYPFRLNEAGRFEHHPAHVREVAASAGLDMARLDEGFLRVEYGKDVMGLFVALTKHSA